MGLSCIFVFCRCVDSSTLNSLTRLSDKDKSEIACDAENTVVDSALWWEVGDESEKGGVGDGGEGEGEEEEKELDRRSSQLLRRYCIVSSSAN